MADTKTPVAAKIRGAFGLPDFSKLTEMMDSRFGALIAKLDEILTELKEIRGEISALQQ